MLNVTDRYIVNYFRFHEKESLLNCQMGDSVVTMDKHGDKTSVSYGRQISSLTSIYGDVL